MAATLSSGGAIAGYFLDLYQRQFQGVEALTARNVSVDLLGDSRVYVFELTVHHDGEHSRRRIGPLGEGTGSKSKCFYVIYDRHMVVKIPPAPIADLATYLAMLQKEAGVAEKTAPLESIVPRVSLILRRIHPFPDTAFPSAEQMEDAYVSLLKKEPKYQKFLKINDQFVFFMDLSQYYFLGHIIKEINDGRKKFIRELSRYAGLIWDPPGFAGRYGQNAENLCFKIQYLFAECESKVKNVLEKHETGNVYAHNLREWFAEFLANQAIPENTALSQETSAVVNECMAAEFSENREAVDEYLRLVKRAVFKRMQIQSRPMKRAVVENLLSLLAHLKKSKVAMRDLKPDNLLAVGDPNDFPGFLSHSKKYRIGLIDMETAVISEPGPGRPPDQPQLGGTPSYATPSHFFPNELLGRCYDDLPRLFSLQDWQAVLAMIYNVVTGDRLFAETSRLFPTILGRLRSLVTQGADPDRLMAETGRLFWRGAMSEFTEKTGKYGNLLTALSIEIPADAIGMLKEEISGTITAANSQVDQWIADHRVVASEKSRRQFKAATSQALAKFADRLKSGPATAKTRQQLSFCLELMRMKAVLETQIRIRDRLDETPAAMNVLEVITVMFHIVHGFMLKPEWNRGR